MDFKLAVTGTLPDGLPPELLESVKDQMADGVQRALQEVPGVEPGAFYLQLGEGTKVNVRTVPAERPATDTEVKAWLGGPSGS